MVTLAGRTAPPARAHRRAMLRVAACAAPLLMSACAAFPSIVADPPAPPTRVEGTPPVEALTPGIGAETQRRQPRSLSIPGAAPVETSTRVPATPEQIDALVSDEIIDAALAPQTIPQFVATAFGGVLGVPFTLGSDVATRTEIIAGGTGGTLSKRNLFRLTQQALRQQGIEVYIEGGFVTVGSNTGGVGSPEVVRDRQIRGTSGRVVQFFNAQTIEVNALQPLLADLFPNLGGARITPDQTSNSLIISGPAQEVAAVVRVLREIDQPRFAGGEVLRVEPVYWSAEQLAASLEQVLTTEGYTVSRIARSRQAFTILAFPAANQVLVFTDDPGLLERARYWVDTLDQPAALGDKATTFVYTVRNTDATSLGQLAIGQSPPREQIQAPVGVPGTIADNGQNSQNGQGSSQPAGALAGSSPPMGSQGQFLTGRLITDPIGNRILFTGTAAEYAQLRTLLNTLDIPAPQVVIEVMIAEVTLTDNTDIGVELFGTEQRGDGLLSGGTEGLAGDSPTGLLLTFVGPEFRARLNAQASNSKVNILQRPQLVTRSGVAARFQVGSDVPIITSQRATDFNSGGNGTDVLQSVQYRQTGTILTLEPVVYGDRVDIKISQELSQVGEDAIAGISSPVILNRALDTQIQIRDGWTGVLGGLISNNYSKSNTGIPFLKDIPLVGSAFQVNSVSGARTELLLLITPRIVRNDEDMADFVNQYTNDINAAFRTGRGYSYTLTPFSFSRSVTGIGLDLPTADRASERPPLFAPRPAVTEDPVEQDTTPPSN